MNTQKLKIKIISIGLFVAFLLVFSLTTIEANANEEHNGTTPTITELSDEEADINRVVAQSSLTEDYTESDDNEASEAETTEDTNEVYVPQSDSSGEYSDSSYDE